MSEDREVEIVDKRGTKMCPTLFANINLYNYMICPRCNGAEIKCNRCMDKRKIRTGIYNVSLSKGEAIELREKLNKYMEK